MRIKYAKVKYMPGTENKWLCTGCLTRFYSRTQARECAEVHNNETVTQLGRFRKDLS